MNLPNLGPMPESNPTGSPNSGEPVCLPIGKLRRPHGVDGEFTMEVLSDFPERIKKGMKILVGEEKREFTFSAVRTAAQYLLVKLEGITEREQAALLRNQIVYVSASTIPPLPEGSYYHHEVIGMTVLDEAGVTIGIITDVIVTGANDVYAIQLSTGGETLIPAIKSVVLSIDGESRTMKVSLPEWD